MSSQTSLLLKIVLITAAMEGVTLLLRFGFGFRSPEATSFLRSFTGGLRIHHGYVGGLLLLPTVLIYSGGPLYGWICATWLSLVYSDVIHHFLILWPITGSPEFDLFYPDGS